MSGKYAVSRWHNDVLDSLKQVGLDISEVRQNEHIVVKGVLNDRPFRGTSSKTPSKQKAYRDMIADLKRELRRCGVAEPPRFAIRYLTALPEPEDIWEALWAWEAQLSSERIPNVSR